MKTSNILGFYVKADKISGVPVQSIYYKIIL